MLNRNIFFFCAILWTLLVGYLSIATLDVTIGNTIEIPNKDKIVHFVFYFLFSILWIFYFCYHRFTIKKSLLVFIVAVSFGVMMEVCQGLFTVTRSPDFFDVIANTSGAFFGWLVTKLYFQYKRN